jgi:uncharacterized iron-regulated membrane protein
MEESLLNKPSGKEKSLFNKLGGNAMRPIHRVAGTIILVFTLYFGVTGSTVQLIDLRTIASHAAATDPDMRAIRESIDGTPNYAVIEPTDYAAAALPEDFDFNSALPRVIKSARLSVGDSAPLKFVELRVIDGKPVALVQAGDSAGDHIVRFDLATGASLPTLPEQARGRQIPSLRGRAKAWHRLNALGDPNVWLNALVGIGLFVMILTGLVMYFQLLRARRRASLNAIFWSAGGWWKSLHRWVSIVAAFFLMVVSITGTLLSIDTLALWVYRYMHAPPGSSLGRLPFPIGMDGDFSTPLMDARLPGMLATTLSAYRSVHGAAPIKVLRLRYFGGMAQGVIITGGDDTRQLVFNADTGKRASMTEPGYPYTGFPFGWEEHELVKKIHRGDALGIPGRLMDLFAGFSLVFLSASGLVMYLDLLRRRRRAGRKQLFWA